MTSKNDFELLDTNNFGMLQWNAAEDITDVEEKDAEKSAGCRRDVSVFDQIFPARKWTSWDDERHATRTWRQTVSREPPTRRALAWIVDALRGDSGRFDDVGNKWPRRDAGLYGLHESLFDEILRQIVITNEELAAILYRVRNELNGMVFVSGTLLEKAMAVTGRYSISTTGDRELADEVDRLTAINDDLKVLASQKYSLLLMEERSDGVDRVQVVAEENHAKEMDSIRNSIVTLREQMNVMTPPKELA